LVHVRESKWILKNWDGEKKDGCWDWKRGRKRRRGLRLISESGEAAGR
jgi:hypothetical protein